MRVLRFWLVYRRARRFGFPVYEALLAARAHVREDAACDPIRPVLGWLFPFPAVIPIAPAPHPPCSNDPASCRVGHAPDRKAASRPSRWCAQELGSVAGAVRLLLFRGRLARADERLREHRADH